MTSTRPTQEGSPALTPFAPMLRGPILVASDGTEVSTPALVMAQLLAAGTGVSVQLLSVLEPLPVIVPPSEAALVMAELDVGREEMQGARLRAQLQSVVGHAPTWPAEVKSGRPAEVLARAARERQAQLVITGLRHRGRFDRLVHGETPLGIARAARVPVLCVPPGVDRLPRVALVAIDLTEASVAAARRARPLLREARTVYLVHVRSTPHAIPEVMPRGWDQLYQQLTRTAFARVVEALDLPAEVQIETRSLTGHPVEEILDFADFARVELIVAGYRRHVLIDRLTGGRSVAERVFRGVSCAILLVPETQRPELRVTESGASMQTEVLSDRATWPKRLQEFLNRNAGRISSLEIDTLDIGAQAQVTGYPLRGIDFDQGRNTVHVMLGDADGRGRHLTHSIADPASVELFRDTDGKDLALRLTHEGGYSLLTF